MASCRLSSEDVGFMVAENPVQVHSSAHCQLREATSVSICHSEEWLSPGSVAPQPTRYLSGQAGHWPAHGAPWTCASDDVPTF